MCWNSTSLSGGQLDLLNTRFANLNSEYLLGELSRNFDQQLLSMDIEHFAHRDELPGVLTGIYF